MTTPDALREAVSLLENTLSKPAILVLKSDKFRAEGWEPGNPNSHIIDELVEQGLFVRSNARCGFEAIKDGWLKPTVAGLLARAALTTTPLAGDRGLPENPSRECTVCTAVVAEWPTVMCCHCYEMPWKLRDAAPTPSNIGDAEARAVREAIVLIDELNERKKSRDFWGIGQTLHAKLCTIRMTLAAAKLSGAGDGLTSEARLLANLFDVDPIKWSGEEVRRLFDLVNAVAAPTPPKATCTPPVGEGK